MAQARHPAQAGLSDTIVAGATPAGGALAVVRLSGEGTKSVATALLGTAPFSPKRSTKRVASHNGVVIDEVVAVFSIGPASATGEDTLELTCHGSALVVRALLDACVANGCRLAEPGEFTRRAFLNGKLDLAQAEAVADLGRAKSESARRAALARLQGGLSRRIENVRAPLFDLLAEVEARLDHPDEEMAPLPTSAIASVLDEARSSLALLISGSERGRLLRDGVRVGLFGRPNAGKSSLLNALLGRDRAIVSPRPGTTRDTIEEQAELAGLPAVLIDTAGLRDAELPEEAEGVKRAEEALVACDVAVLVSDATGPREEADKLLNRARQLRPRGAIVSAWNKTDLCNEPPAGGWSVSAKTGAGVETLAAAVAAAAGSLDNGDEEAPACGGRQEAALRAALAALDSTHNDLTAEDLLASRLRAVLAHLGATLGEDAAPDVLDAVFSRFCLGK